MIRGLLNKVISWPFSTEPKCTDSCNWREGERQAFYGYIEQGRFNVALRIIKSKATKHSMKEMGDLMKALGNKLNKNESPEEFWPMGTIVFGMKGAWVQVNENKSDGNKWVKTDKPDNISIVPHEYPRAEVTVDVAIIEAVINELEKRYEIILKKK